MRIVRFIDETGLVQCGEDEGNDGAAVLEGSLINGYQRTARRAKIAKLLAPVVPTDIICIGRNYRSPSAGAAELTDETLEVFLKPSTALQNPMDAILIPRFDGVDVQLDCEGELAIIIGRDSRNVQETEAIDHVLGFTLALDVTARHFQTPTGPPLWMRGKGFDTFCPLGPAIITADETADPQGQLRTIVNGQVVRDGHTRDMIRSVPRLIADLSRHMTLRAGAVILTGAPPAPPHALRDGDRIDVEFDGLGRLSTTVRGAR